MIETGPFIGPGRVPAGGTAVDPFSGTPVGTGFALVARTPLEGFAA